MSATVKFKSLFQFFGGYFNQDWKCDDPTVEAVVERFLKEHSPDYIQNVVSELDSLLSKPLTDDELRRMMYEELACYYRPKEGASMRAWLIHVHGLLTA